MMHYVVPLNECKGEKNIFFFPLTSGGTKVYDALAKYLQPKISVFGLRTPGAQGERSCFNTVEQLAEFYFNNIDSTQYCGSLNFFGWSIGGILAHATATIAVRKGRSVDSVGLLDTVLQPERFQTELTSEEWVEWGYWLTLSQTFFRSDYLDTSITAYRSTFQNLGTEAKLDYLLSDGVRLNFRNPWKDTSIVELRRFSAYYKNQWVAVRRDFIPSYFDGRLYYIQALDSLREDSWKDWQLLSGPNFRREYAPGSHRLLMYEPYVKEIANLILTNLNIKANY